MDSFDIIWIVIVIVVIIIDITDKNNNFICNKANTYNIITKAA